MKINTNLSSLIVQSGLKASTNGLNTAIERLTTGSKINHAKDNAANYAINTKLSTQINAYQMAEDNVRAGLDMVQTASSALSNVSDLTSRLRMLAIQAQNDTYGSKSISAINQEAASIINEIYRIKSSTEYNGIKLFDSTHNLSKGISLPDGTTLKPNSRGFLKDIVKRDTSNMTTLESVDENTILTSGTYSISTAEELAQLATMTNAGKIGENTEFVLANNIDLSAYDSWTPIGKNRNLPFYGTFDGNGYVVSNLKIVFNKKYDLGVGLFGNAGLGSEIKNLGMINPFIHSESGWVGSIAGSCFKVTNCYSIGGSVTTTCYDAGGLTGVLGNNSESKPGYIVYSYSTTNAISMGSQAGGLAAYAAKYSVIEYSFAMGDVVVTDKGGEINPLTAGCIAGGITANAQDGCLIRNCAALGNVSGKDCIGMIAGNETNSIYTVENCIYNLADSLKAPCYSPNAILNNVVGVNLSSSFVLQIGIHSQKSSELEFSIPDLNLSSLEYSVTSGVEVESTLHAIDKFLEKLWQDSSALGAIENRLESALEEISAAYDNLVSTQSTIRDADIAEESSAYIRNQILQQAAATLMATANLTPAIALQLL